MYQSFPTAQEPNGQVFSQPHRSDDLVGDQRLMPTAIRLHDNEHDYYNCIAPLYRQEWLSYA